MAQPAARDSGFTLIEVLVVMSLMGAMMAIAVSGWDSWARASEHKGAAQEVQSLLRSTQQTAVSGGSAMCVDFDVANNRIVVSEGACGSADLTERETRELPAGVSLSSPNFKVAEDSAPEPSLTFFARGTASSGTVAVARDGASPYVLSVEGLSGHVSMS